MKTKEYSGIDYGLGRSNVDRKTGIRFGVISIHSIMPEAAGEIYDHGKDLAYDAAVSDLQSEFKTDPEALERELEALNCAWETNLGNLLFEREGYRITGCLDSDIIVFKSPYYTHAQFCSPCVPGAGNLDSPCPTGPRTYCLGHDWFEGGKAPYSVYLVETDEMIEP